MIPRYKLQALDDENKIALATAELQKKGKPAAWWYLWNPDECDGQGALKKFPTRGLNVERKKGNRHESIYDGVDGKGYEVSGDDLIAKQKLVYDRTLSMWRQQYEQDARDRGTKNKKGHSKNGRANPSTREVQPSAS